MKSAYRSGANVFEWLDPFKPALRFESNAPLRFTIELRSKRWLGLRGRTVCSFTLQIEQDCQSATFNLRANEPGIPSSPELSVTLTAAGLAPAGGVLVQGIQNAPVVTISGPDDTENIASGPTPSTPDPHVSGGVPASRPTAPTHPLLNPAAHGANNQLLSQALAESNDALRKQSTLDLRAPSIAESNTEAAGPTAEAAAQIAWSGVSRISAVMELVNVAADIHPLVKGVWSLLNVAYTLAKQQSDLDIKVGDLVDALDANCELARVLTKDQIAGVAETIVTKILQEVLNGADVIKEYCTKRQSKLSVFRFAGSTTAIRVDACLRTLEVFRRDLADHVAANVHRDLHGLQTLALKLEVDLKAVKAKIDHIDDYVQTQEDKALLDQMMFAPEADRALRSRNRGCLLNTRVEIVDAIVNWAIGADGGASQSYIKGLHRDSRILWLCGVAGSGKSSIAISVARALRSMNRLAALYGFEKAFQTSLNTTNLFSTIARQRANRRPEHKRRLIQKLRQMQPELRATTDAGEQFKLFMATALAEDLNAADDVVVIDAFDESGSIASRSTALQALSSEYSTTFPKGVRFIVTSRYDPDIARRLESATARAQSFISVFQMEDIHPPHTERDIELYVFHMLQDVEGLEPSRAAGRLAQLAVTAEHSFQWASTSCRYIGDDDDHDGSRLPADRLEETLATRGGLDSLYLSILDHFFGAGIDRASAATDPLRFMLGNLVCALEPVSVQSMAALASAGSSSQMANLTSFHLLARKLSSILIGTKDKSTPLVAFHTSFTDFLTDPQRSRGYAVDSVSVHLHMALGSLALMRKLLRFNICQLESSFLRNDAVPDLAERIKKHIPDALSYACRFWPVHVAAAALSSASADVKALQESFSVFLENKLLLLQWLEVVSLTDSNAYDLLGPLSSLQNKNRDLSDLVTFTAFFAIPISTGVPHIYLSALAFAPTSSLIIAPVSTHFPHLVHSDPPLFSWPQVRHKLEHSLGVQCIAFSPDSRRMVSGEGSNENEDPGGGLVLFDTYSGMITLPRMSTSSAVLSVAFSPDGNLVASGHKDGTIQIWDASTMTARGKSLSGHTDWVRSVAFSPDGALLASGADDSTIRFWDPRNGASVGKPLTGHEGWVLSVMFSPSGLLLASGSADKMVKLWDVPTLSPIGEPLTGHTGGVRSVVFSPDGALLVSGSNDGTIRFWDVNAQFVIGEPLTTHDSYINSVVFSPDGQTFASSSDNKTVRLWDAERRSPMCEPLTGHTGGVNSVAFSPDGTLLASGSSDKTVHIWDARDLASNQESPATQFKIQDFATFSPDGKLLASGSDDRAIQLWDVDSVSTVGEPLRGHTQYIRAVAFSPDGTLLASGSDNKTVQLWDVHTASAAGEPFKGHQDWARAVAFSPNGELLASGSDDGTIRLWDTHARSASGEPLRGHFRFVKCVALSPDGLTLASGDVGGTVRLWDVQTRSQIGQALKGHSDWVQCLVFSPDGTLLASSSDDKTVRLWDVLAQSAVGEPLKGHDIVTSLAFSPDGALLVFSSKYDSIGRVWDVRVPSQVKEPVALLRHESNIYSITFLSKSAFLSSVTSSGVVRKWGLEFLLSAQASNVHSISKDDPEKPSSSLALLPCHPDLASLSPDSLVNLDDGWVIGPQGELILWVPPTVRSSLSDLREAERFGGSLTRLDFTKFVCGSDWAKCYSPPPSTSTSNS